MVGAVAWAQPRISVHPLSVEQGRRGERWNDLFMREIAKQPIAMTPEVEVEAFLGKNNGHCRNETKCLRDLGYATKAYYILAGSMLRTENVYTIHVRVLLLNGVEVKKVSLDMERVSKTSEEANAVALYEKLFAELKLDSLPAHPPGVSLYPPEKEIVKETVIETEEVVLMPDGSLRPKQEVIEEREKGLSPVRKTSYVFMGVAGAAALTGAVFALSADSNFRRFNRDYGDVASPEADIAAAKKLRSKVSTQKTLSIVSFSVATAAAATGITLFYISPERVKVSFLPTPGGTMFSLQGVFP